MHAFAARRNTIVALTISAAANNYDIFAQAGSPAGVVDVLLTINATVGDSAAAGYALRTGSGWAAGSTIRIVNNSFVEGRGGNGNGGNGGDAVSLGWDVTIDNTNGYIRGPGGGGALGSPEGSSSPNIDGAGGGGGGGGIGNPNGSAGAGQSTYAAPGSAGTAGTARTARGTGGSGGNNPTYGNFGGDGGSGGDWGQPGETASPSSPHNFAGGSAGQPGFAIRQNSKAIAWIGGNNSTQVVGTVA